MQVTGKVVVVTGGGNGIGRAMCEAFHGAGAAKVVVADIDPNAARPMPLPPPVTTTTLPVTCMAPSPLLR